VSVTGNITAGNILGGANVNATTHTGATVSVTGNITGNYFIGNGSQLTGIASTYGNANVAANLAAFGSNPISTSGNITAGNIIGTHVGNVTGTTVSVTGNITGNYFVGNGSQLTGIVSSYGNANVTANLAAFGSNPISTSGNITAGNIIGTHVGNVTGTTVSVTGNVTGANLNATGLSLSGNVVSVLVSAANITTTANIAGGYVLGNGSQLTGVVSSYGNANVTANLAAFGTNPVSTSGNITGGNIIGIVAAGANAITTTANITGGNINAAGLSLSSNVISALNSTANITTTANITGGNLLTGGNVYTPTNNTGLVGGITVLGQAYVGSFNGTNQDLSISSSTLFNMGTGSFTVEGWIYLRSYPATAGQLFGTTVGTSGYALNVGQNINSLRITSNASGSWQDDITVTAGNGVPLNTWTHLAMVKDGNSLVLYKNGSIVASTTGVSSWNYSSPGNYGDVGFFAGGVNEYLYAYISNIRVVKGVAVYTGAFTVPTGPLTATASANPFGGANTAAITGTATSLLTLQNSTVIDNSSYVSSITNTGTVTTGLQTVPFGSGVYAGTFLYDGSTWQSTPISVTGNVTATYLIGNGSQLTGIVSSYGNANVTANLAAFGTNPISTSGNITGGNIIGTHVGNVTGATVSVTGNITGGNLNVAGLSLSSNVVSALNSTANITTTANISGGFILGNGSQLTGIVSSYGNANVAANLAAFGSNPISTSGNITGGNIIGTHVGNVTGTTVSVTGNITGGNINAAGLSLSSNVVSALNSAANITTTANISGGNIIGTHVGNVTGTTVSVTGNITGGNVLFGSGVVSGTGNITGGNLNVAGLSLSSNVVSVLNATGNIAGGNITTPGLISATGNITGGNIIGIVAAGANTITTTGNITGGNVLFGSGVISGTGNITGGNILGGANVNATTHTGATVSVTGNITGGNINAAGLSLSSNVISVLVSAANITTTANISGGFILGNGSQLTGIVASAGASITNGTSNVTVSASSNITANVAGSAVATWATTGQYVTGVISATGNITAGNILGGANVNATTLTGATVSVTGNIITGGGIVSRVVPISDATSVTINADTTDLATQTNTQVTGTLTVNAPTGTLANGQKITFRLQSSNVQTFSWNTVFAGSTDLSLPTTSSGSSKYDYMGFIYNSTATKWQLLAKNFGF